MGCQCMARVVPTGDGIRATSRRVRVTRAPSYALRPGAVADDRHGVAGCT